LSRANTTGAIDDDTKDAHPLLRKRKRRDDVLRGGVE